MKFNKLVLPALTALALASIQIAAVAQAAVPTLGADIKGLTVYGKTYVTSGASSIIRGNVFSGDVLTTGDSAAVLGYIKSVGASNVGGGTASVGSFMESGGVATVGAGGNIGTYIKSSGAATIGANALVGTDMTSGGIATTGDSAWVMGKIVSGGYASIGANSHVVGTVYGVGATVMGAGGAMGGTGSAPTSPLIPVAYTSSLVSIGSTDASQVTAAQSGFSALGMGTALSTTMPTSMTLTGGGVFSAANFSTTASMTLTLDDQNVRHDWVFNITDYLVTGASSKVVMSNANSGSTLTWNVGSGYASLGASSNFMGTILAKTYIAVGASTVVSGFNSSCGIYSATSYVSTGASADIGGGCVVPVTPVPEPEGYAMLLAGLISIAFISRRRKAAK